MCCVLTCAVESLTVKKLMLVGPQQLGQRRALMGILGYGGKKNFLPLVHLVVARDMER
jgi:hypothetical protein